MGLIIAFKQEGIVVPRPQYVSLYDEQEVPRTEMEPGLFGKIFPIIYSPFYF